MREVVGEAVRELGERVCRRGRDQVHIGVLDEREVADRRVLGRRDRPERRRARDRAPTRC